MNKKVAFSLTHSKCWNPKSRLKTSREEGAGWGQITKAYNKDGTIRFDSLRDLRNKHPKELYEWSWENVYDRPDLQARGIILMMRDNYSLFEPYGATSMDSYAFADSAYNGGARDVNLSRRACKISNTISSPCDSGKWFDNVEKFCVKSKVPLYGNRDACTINIEHVNNVMRVRAEKYRKYF